MNEDISKPKPRSLDPAPHQAGGIAGVALGDGNLVYLRQGASATNGHPHPVHPGGASGFQAPQEGPLPHKSLPNPTAGPAPGDQIFGPGGATAMPLPAKRGATGFGPAPEHHQPYQLAQQQHQQASPVRIGETTPGLHPGYQGQEKGFGPVPTRQPAPLQPQFAYNQPQPQPHPLQQQPVVQYVAPQPQVPFTLISMMLKIH